MQEALADLSGLSLDMIAKIEGCSSGASFNTIEHLSRALSVGPAALFEIDMSDSRFGDGLSEIVPRLAALSDDDIAWVKALLEVALRREVAGKDQAECSPKTCFVPPCQSASKIHPLSASNFDPPGGVNQRLACPALAGVAEGRPSAGDDRLRL
ncbi:helix-turn-helix domain-containing protein [Rhizobium leguminosarum]|uniref:helix-turn-helix domain-containing protein n=1 Tax=Rhizobium leguminosarum TaxID=384 RepID=UPI0013AF0A7E|nr:hypothetical protein [Rhizobium leguminosarum]